MALDQPGFWCCQHEHVFTWGDESWHRDASQSWSLTDESYAPFGAPSHCPADWGDCEYARHYDMVGDPCLESSVLVGPHPTPQAALAAVRKYKARWWTHEHGIDPTDAQRLGLTTAT